MDRRFEYKMNTGEVIAIAPALAPEKRDSRPVHIEDFDGGVKAAEEELRSGRSSLRLSVYPWGVEFDVVREDDGVSSAELIRERSSR